MKNLAIVILLIAGICLSPACTITADSSEEDYSNLTQKYNQLVDEYNVLHSQYNELVDEYNALRTQFTQYADAIQKIPVALKETVAPPYLLVEGREPGILAMESRGTRSVNHPGPIYERGGYCQPELSEAI
ncbi:hypothetical protein ACFLW3_01010 [Chloroflexota bacterium]